MNSKSRQEGFNDGLAGSGIQDRTSSTPRDWFDDTLYREGFLAGSVERWKMLRADEARGVTYEWVPYSHHVAAAEVMSVFDKGATA